jgi:uncharacterized protein (TIGR03118 family)
MKTQSKVTLLVAFVGSFLLALTPVAARAVFIQTNLVSDIPGLALVTDPSLKNPWGLFHTPTSPWWANDQAANVATLYNTPTGGAVTKNALVVTMPSVAGSLAQGPTGGVFNSTTLTASPSFLLGPTPSTAANFIFANLNGTIDAWNNAQGTTALNMAQVTGASYTGLTLITNASGPFLLAANNAQNRIDVFNQTNPGSAFQLTSLAGNFTNPNLPAGFVPFNVQVIGNNVYVTYALAGRLNALGAAGGQGLIGVFDLNGNFIRQISDSHLASPWGITLAPAGFGEFGNDLLVGNFSAALSEINAFDPNTGAFLGSIPINTGGNAPGGLWALAFGNANNNGDPNTLFFTDGLNSEANGLFASIRAVPEPGTLSLLALGTLSIGGWRRRRVARIAKFS